MRTLFEPQVIQSIKTIIDYLWDEEEKNYNESQRVKLLWNIDDHTTTQVFQSLVVLKSWMEKTRNDRSSSSKRLVTDALRQLPEESEETAIVLLTGIMRWAQQHKRSMIEILHAAQKKLHQDNGHSQKSETRK